MCIRDRITVEKPSIGKQPQNVSVKAGEQATFTVAATGTDLKYQWQIDRNDGKGFADIAGADRASYTTSAVDKNCNGYKYQCVIRNSAGSVTTGTATLTVTEDVTPPVQPLSLIHILDLFWGRFPAVLKHIQKPSVACHLSATELCK